MNKGIIATLPCVSIATVAAPAIAYRTAVTQWGTTIHSAVDLGFTGYAPKNYIQAEIRNGHVFFDTSFADEIVTFGLLYGVADNTQAIAHESLRHCCEFLKL